MIYPVAFLNFCATLEHKPTSLRKNVLYLLWAANKPLKAYEILDQLLLTQLNAKPPSIYRVLDYFVDCGVVHKIDSIQSYTLCREHEKGYTSEILMVCDHCRQVQEFYDETLHVLVKQLSEVHQFHLGQQAIEIRGICSQCKGLSHFK